MFPQDWTRSLVIAHLVSLCLALPPAPLHLPTPNPGCGNLPEWRVAGHVAWSPWQRVPAGEVSIKVTWEPQKIGWGIYRSRLVLLWKWVYIWLRYRKLCAGPGERQGLHLILPSQAWSGGPSPRPSSVSQHIPFPTPVPAAAPTTPADPLLFTNKAFFLVGSLGAQDAGQWAIEDTLLHHSPKNHQEKCPCSAQ